jgi:peptide/nickel transport system ATP-binding protein
MPNLLEIDNLRIDIRSKRKSLTAVDGVSLAVGKGEIVGLVGESGSGKSLTALSVVDLLPHGARIVSGSIVFDGTELVGASSRTMRGIRGGRIGMVFQDPMTALNPTMTVGAQIAEPLLVHHQCTKSEANDRTIDLLRRVGFATPVEQARVYPHQLSGGLRQRAVIATAIACSPDLVIADEPTTALDVTIQAQILDLLNDLRDSLGISILLITHDLGVVAQHTDRTVVMYAGEFVESGPTRTLFLETQHPYTDALLGSVPRVGDSQTGQLYSISGRPPDLTKPIEGCRFMPRCEFARDACHETRPRLEQKTGDQGHLAACLFPLTEGATVRVRADRPDRVPEGEKVDDRKEPLFVIKDVVKTFPLAKRYPWSRRRTVKALSGVSLDIWPGETLGIVGESGCGKTTLARIITGLDAPDSGTTELRVDGAPAKGAAANRLSRRNVQLMFQDPYSSLDPRMRIRSILNEPLSVQRMGDKPWRAQRMQEALGDVGLDAEVLALYPHEFSGGQRQRIGLARALLPEPQLVVADEPVSAQDASVRAQVLNLMVRLQAEMNLTLVVITHDLTIVHFLAHRVAVMYLGKVVEVGPARSVYVQPSHPYTVGHLAAAPSVDAIGVEGRPQEVMVRGELPSSTDPPSGCRFRTRCPRAEQLCAEVEPPLRPMSGLEGHLAACHFPHQPGETAATVGSGVHEGR